MTGDTERQLVSLAATCPEPLAVRLRGKTTLKSSTRASAGDPLAEPRSPVSPRPCDPLPAGSVPSGPRQKATNNASRTWPHRRRDSPRSLVHVGAQNSAVVVDLSLCGPMLSPRVPHHVPIPGPRMERETPGQRPRPNYGHPQARSTRAGRLQRLADISIQPPGPSSPSVGSTQRFGLVLSAEASLVDK